MRLDRILLMDLTALRSRLGDARRSRSCPQEKDTCAAASLAMVLRYWNVDRAPGRDRRRALCSRSSTASWARASRPSPASAASRPSPTRATSRSSATTSAKGRPLIVALEGRSRPLPRRRGRRLRRTSGEIVVNDPGRRRRRAASPARDFEKRWAGAGHWTLLVLPADRRSPSPSPWRPRSSRPRSHESYDALVARGRGRTGKAGTLGGGAPASSTTRSLSTPTRPEARVERGGLIFLEKRYDDAARELRRGSRLREDALHARPARVVAAARRTRRRGARGLERLGQPTSRRRSRSAACVHTRDRVARREVRLAEGDVLTLARVREARLRLREVGVFDRVTVRATPLGDGGADLTSRSSSATACPAAGSTSGATVGTKPSSSSSGFATPTSPGPASRWRAVPLGDEPARRRRCCIAWPRPLGLDADAAARGLRGRQLYEVEASRSTAGPTAST